MNFWRWLASLANSGLAPPTRKQMIPDVRRYLSWLAERGDFNGDPGALLRIEDLPKIPSYLSRPFPPEIDIELQRETFFPKTYPGTISQFGIRSSMNADGLILLYASLGEPRCGEAVFYHVAPIGGLKCHSHAAIVVAGVVHQ